jgi:hypothetical protein
MRKAGPNLLRWSSIALILAALGLFFYELVAYSRLRARLPQGLTIAGVPVGEMDSRDALERVLQTYSTPIELHYDDQIILLSPTSVGFRVDSEGMMAVAELMRTGTDFWSGFWEFLWNRYGPTEPIPLRAEYSRAELEEVLRDIAARYDEAPTASQPIPGRPEFQPGTAGRTLDIARAAELVGTMLTQPTNRRVILPVMPTDPPRPGSATLVTLLKQIIDVANFDGLAVLYIQDLRSGDVMHFAYFRNADFPRDPDIAFTAASIIKIGVMVGYYRYYDEPLDAESAKWMNEMIIMSGNEPADWLMESLDPDEGPIRITETLRDLGLESTFLAGHFYLGAELLRIYATPGNQRTDINTRPDIYNQTTASEIGMLLSDIYACTHGGGTLIAAFPESYSPEECRHMLDLLAENRIGILIEAGVPEGTRVAHKHGWTDSPLDMLSDVGIVFSPGGDYVLSAFLWNSQGMIWDPTSKLFADLSRAIYNYFNLPVDVSGLAGGS